MVPAPGSGMTRCRAENRDTRTANLTDKHSALVCKRVMLRARRSGCKAGCVGQHRRQATASEPIPVSAARGAGTIEALARSLEQSGCRVITPQAGTAVPFKSVVEVQWRAESARSSSVGRRSLSVPVRRHSAEKIARAYRSVVSRVAVVRAKVSPSSAACRPVRQNRVSMPATDVGRGDGRVLGPPAHDGIARLGIGQRDGRAGSGKQPFHLNFDAP